LNTAFKVSQGHDTIGYKEKV